MDQSAALLARAGHTLLLDFTDGAAEHVPWEASAAGLALVVVDTGVSHRLSDGGYASRRTECESAARLLGLDRLRQAQGQPRLLEGIADARLRRRARHVLSEMDRVDETVGALRAGDLPAVGPLLDASHESLRYDFEVSCDELDVAVATCRAEGAIGARMTGGGFGGSAIALLPLDAVERTAGAVAGEFASRSWKPPRFLYAPAGPGARRLR
jgi:galactokinase